MSKVIVSVVLDPQKLGFLLMHGAIKTISKEFDIDSVNLSNKLVVPIDPQKHNYVDVFIENSGEQQEADIDEAIIHSAMHVGAWTEEMSSKLREGKVTKLYIDIPTLKQALKNKGKTV